MNNVNHGLWVIIICQQMFITCNKCTTWAGDADNTWGYACVWSRTLWETSVPSCQFCYEHKTALHQQNINQSKQMSRRLSKAYLRERGLKRDKVEMEFWSYLGLIT